MNTRCPNCGTVYQVDPEALLAANGKARCYNCDTIFDTRENAEPPPASLKREATESIGSGAPDESELQFSFEVELQNEPDLPFDLADDVSDLTPSASSAVGIHETLEPNAKARSPGWQRLLVVLLGLTLALQALWWWRLPLLQQPWAAPLCEHLDCSQTQQRDPQAFSVIERSLIADPQDPKALRLWVRVRNEAAFAQPWPHVQLTLSDTIGNTMARRSVTPFEYLYPTPSEIPIARANEVFTIELLFEDPGNLASGFELSFY